MRLIDAALASKQRYRLLRLVAPYWRATRRENPDEWGARSRIYGPETGVPGPRNPKLTPYAIPFARAVGSGGKPLTVMVTAAQSGKTESFLDVIGERLDNRPAPILYVGPSKEFNTDQFEPRIRDLLLQSKSLLSKVVGGIDGKRQKKTLKRIAGVTLRLASARSTTALKSSPASLGLVDEYDEMLRALRDQGDVLGLILARGETYADFTCGVTSTPSQGLVEIELDAASGLEFWAIADEDNVSSPIWRLWQAGSRHHWCWPCPHCSQYFVPRFKQLRYPPDATPAQALRNTWLECPRCEGRIEERHKDSMNARGDYVAPGETISSSGRKGGTAPDAMSLTLWVSGLCSPFRTFGQRAERYLTALATKSGAEIQTAINAAFGEVTTPAGGDLPAWEDVHAKAVGFPAGVVPPDVVAIVAGVDVQKNSLVFVIRGFGVRGTSWLIRHGELWGPTKDTAVWDQLAELLLTPIDGTLIKLALIDSGFRPGQKSYLPVNRVYDFCRRYGRFVYPTKGSSTPMVKPMLETALEVKSEDGSSKAYGLRLIRLDPDHWKATVHERLGLPSDAPGCLHLNSDADEEYCRQLVSEARVRGANGQNVWVQLQKANHYLDAEALAAAAAFRLDAENFGARAAEKRRERMTPVIGSRPSEPPPAARCPVAAPHRPTMGRMASWARRFNGR